MIRVERIINRVFASNSYVISNDDSKNVWLVDIGDMERVLQLLSSGFTIMGLFLTHTHFDHIYGIKELQREFPDCKVLTSEYGKKALSSSKLNFSFYYDSPVEYQGDNVEVLSEGDKVELFPSVWIEVYETPGHCPSCLTYQLEDMLFTGDSFIPYVKVVSKLPKGDKQLALASRERIIKMSVGKIVCPGHGEMVPYSIDRVVTL